MPDLQQRTDFETQLADNLARIFDRARVQAQTSPQLVDYSKLEQDTQEELRRVLIIIYLLSLDSMSEFGTVQETVRQDRSQAHVQARTKKFAADFRQDVSESVGRAAINAQKQVSQGTPTATAVAEYNETINRIFSRTRAETIAITEITSTISAGETEFAELWNRLDEIFNRPLGQAAPQPGQQPGSQQEPPVNQSPIIPTSPPAGGDGASLSDGQRKRTLVAFWQTENDAKVCPICSPNHNKREKPGDPTNWTELFPSGPPAHPRCRCYLEWKLI